ncbi:hypothetical protein HIM_00761 [Hirsutella minnesotensis 3608]|nr:hypothetical protein HIM_00761 [Hirsutella minnesotensis 3608]
MASTTNGTTRATRSLSSLDPQETVLKLPHPYHTAYTIQPSGASTIAKRPLYQLRETVGSSRSQPPCLLTANHIFFSEPACLDSGELPSSSNNTAWARAARSPCSDIAWDGQDAPSPAQTWLLIYVLFTLRSSCESLQLRLQGKGAAALAEQLEHLSLVVRHPRRPGSAHQLETDSAASSEDVLRITQQGPFWQGAGCPFGPRPVWLPDASPKSLQSSSLSLASFPPSPLFHTTTITSAGDPHEPTLIQQSRHPLRLAKPAPGATIYSRWIPHLKETFSMVALDCEDEEHLRLVNTWMNDPRVAQAWNEDGSLEHHRQYLRGIHKDPHQIAVLGKFDDTFFAYYELYWAKEDRIGGYYDAGDYDRGRHLLVGDSRFRGPHRVSAWWSSQTHYLFLDDVRTMSVVCEPRATNPVPTLYDMAHGANVEGLVDLPHKRSALSRCTRARFFQSCPMAEQEKSVCGVRISLAADL